MSGTIWSKFFWSDWMSDPALRLCSVGARGLWMDMLCIAAAHEPPGYVAVGGQPLGVTPLARMVGADVNEVAIWLVELDGHGVFSVDRKKRIYCRRMVKDAKAMKIARQNGEKGGNPSLGKRKASGARDNPPGAGGVIPQKPEARSQDQKDVEPKGSVPAFSEDFLAGWKAYPKSGVERSKSRAICWKLWRDAARLAGGEAALLGALRRYVSEDKQHKTECGAPALDRWLAWGRWDHFLGGNVQVVTAPFPEAAVRQHVVAEKGEAWTASWLDPSGWDEEFRVIRARPTAAGKLRAELRAILAHHEVKVGEYV